MAYSDDTQSAQTNKKLEDLVQVALCEAQIESLVIAKGYTDCVTYISDEGVSVAVAAPEGGLAKADVAVIADIVMTQSEFTMEDIRVVEVQ
jgi:stage III sporulation protein AH